MKSGKESLKDSELKLKSMKHYQVKAYTKRAPAECE